MRVLVTGGAGFIGSHIVDQLLAAGHEPHVVDDLSNGRRENLPAAVPLHVLDVRDADAVAGVFARVQPELVCHQAAQMSVSRSVREPAFDAAVNVIGLLHVLDNAVKAGAKRFVFASSCGVYGDVTDPAGEEALAAPISPYGITKSAGEQYLQFYAREHGLPCVALRYANVYGPRQNPHGEAGVAAIFCQRLLRGEAATINGDGRYIRDYVHVRDVARANILALERPVPAAFVLFNVGTATRTDVNELATLVRNEVRAWKRSAGQPEDVPELQHGPARAGDLRSNLISFDRIRDTLGWRPNIGLADGLRETVAWFAEEGSSS